MKQIENAVIDLILWSLEALDKALDWLYDLGKGRADWDE